MAKKEEMTFAEFKAQFIEGLYDEYHVKLYLNTISGGIPAHPDLIKEWIKAMMAKKKTPEERAKMAEITESELAVLSEEMEAKSWNVFKRDKNGHVFIEGRCAKAMLKEAANIIKPIADRGTKITNFKHKVAENVFVVEPRVFFTRDGERLSKPDMLVERPIHVDTRQGPRSSIKRLDALYDVEAEFTMRRLITNTVPEEALYGCLVFAMQLGFGSGRSQGWGVMKNVECKKTKIAKDIKKQLEQAA